MAIFTVEIDDPAHLAGITSARLAYNNTLPDMVDDEGNYMLNPEFIASDMEYVQFVMSRAAESYSRQYGA